MAPSSDHAYADAWAQALGRRLLAIPGYEPGRGMIDLRGRVADGVLQGQGQFIPDLRESATRGVLLDQCIEAWSRPREGRLWRLVHGRPFDVELVARHRWDPVQQTLVPAYIARVIVFCDTWREEWSSDVAATKAEALVACREAVPQ